MELQHPIKYTEGVRILLLASRTKDGAQKTRRITRISNNSIQFVHVLEDLLKIKDTSDRIYVSLSQRDVTKAARLFKHRIIEAEYDSDTESFYKDIHNQWVSCLMIKTSTLKKDTLWMFDCDTEQDYEIVTFLESNNIPIEYQYPTRNGKHVIVKPFNRKILEKRFLDILHDNPLMLWS